MQAPSLRIASSLLTSISVVSTVMTTSFRSGPVSRSASAASLPIKSLSHWIKASRPDWAAVKSGAEIERPGAPVLFQPERHQCAIAVGLEAEICALFLETLMKFEQVLRRTVDLVAEFAGKRHPHQHHRHTGDIGAADIAELQNISGKRHRGRGATEVAANSGPISPYRASHRRRCGRSRHRPAGAVQTSGGASLALHRSQKG